MDGEEMGGKEGRRKNEEDVGDEQHLSTTHITQECGERSRSAKEREHSHKKKRDSKEVKSEQRKQKKTKTRKRAIEGEKK